MRQWTIRARIVASFGVVLALILLLAGGAFVELSRMVRATRSLQVDAMGGLQQGELLQAAWYDTPLSWAAIGYPGPPSLAANRLSTE